MTKPKRRCRFNEWLDKLRRQREKAMRALDRIEAEADKSRAAEKKFGRNDGKEEKN